MNSLNVRINYWGCKIAPPEWGLSHAIRIQRLYYIKGGCASYIDGSGHPAPFLRGKIYVMPYNFLCRFKNSLTDPIDHIFFDFFSTPPIIAPEPLIYDVAEGSSLRHMLTMLEQLFSEIGNDELSLLPTERQLIEQLLSAVLSMLSMQSHIPFIDDPSVCDTLEYIHQNYALPISTQDLAGRAGFEVNYFIRRFKSVMCTTPYAYLRSYRLLKASEQLFGGATVVQAAEAVGYENASSLSRALASISNI